MAFHCEIPQRLFFLPTLLVLVISSLSKNLAGDSFPIREVSVHDLQAAFQQKQLSSRELVEFYLGDIRKLNPVLRGVIEVNPDALDQADKAD
uniref:Amidase n=1 Tax=Nelumbo nucifera TaxID=4432 RepID=A0A822ZVC2_NELNU|nr:TPA_asm: hypothetical protein HUJ06_019129 [Nelumbo nucifera]